MRNFLGAAALSLSSLVVQPGCATTKEASKVETVASTTPEASRNSSTHRNFTTMEEKRRLISLLTHDELIECLDVLSVDPLPGQDLGKCTGLTSSSVRAELTMEPLREAVRILEENK